jgi:hypothetical protein
MTPEQIERVLPSVPAGITSGDLTDHDDRFEFARRLAAIYAEAQRAPDPELEALLDEEEAISRAQRASRRRLVRNGRLAVVASNDFPPPAKGTHESDLPHLSPYVYGGKTIVAGRAHDVWDDEALYEPAEWIVARDWSRA